MAKDKKAQAGPGDKVELAHKDTGFSDPETGFKIVRDQTAKLGDTIGKKTHRALLSGTLLVVGSAAAKKAAAEAEPEAKSEGGKAK